MTNLLPTQLYTKMCTVHTAQMLYFAHFFEELNRKSKYIPEYVWSEIFKKGILLMLLVHRDFGVLWLEYPLPIGIFLMIYCAFLESSYVYDICVIRFYL